MTESELGMTYPEDHIQHITCAACRSLPMSRDYSRKIYYEWLNVCLVTHIGAQAYVQRGGAELEGAAIAGRFRLNRGSSEVETSDNSCLGEFRERSGAGGIRGKAYIKCIGKPARAKHRNRAEGLAVAKGFPSSSSS